MGNGRTCDSCGCSRHECECCNGCHRLRCICEERPGDVRTAADLTRLGTEQELLQDLTSRGSLSIDDDIAMF